MYNTEISDLNSLNRNILLFTSLWVALLLSLLLETALSAPPAMTPPRGAIVRAPKTSDGLPMT